MTTVLDTIPEPLRDEVDAAVAWFNTQERDQFEATGIVDPPEGPATDAGRPLRLVLCGAGQCRQESFQSAPANDGFDVGFLDAAPVAGNVATLDPPPGAMRNWVDETVDRHDFVVFVFYRGFW